MVNKMVSSNLVFFGTHQDSRLGTLRTLFSFPLFVIVVGLLLLLSSKGEGTMKKVVATLMIALVMCSAVGVQLPKTCFEAGLYGGLVGLVVGTVVSAFSLVYAPDAPIIMRWSILILPLLTIPITLVSYALSKHFNFYPSPK